MRKMLKIAFIGIKIVMCVFDNSFCSVKGPDSSLDSDITYPNQSHSPYTKPPKRR
jgi:hypothetical protein